MTAEPVARDRRTEAGDDALAPDAFKRVFRGHPAGVVVVTLRDGHARVGFTATSVISVSADPPLLAFSLAASSSSWPAVSRAETVALSFLADHQDDVSARFATSGIDRFAPGGWTDLATGEPVIDGSAAWVRGRIVQRTAVGGSHLIAVEALTSSVRDERETCDRSALAQVRPPLVYHDRTYHRIGEHSAI
ncbi:flavin reductase family protein [Cellulomonas alba]|uniref:Flavin reductase family protein n=1 Tax=Cellulomonas alba TaxID=3053467 RepID=A0ABT7SE98_9CELL|nr:flavin reductase family protein [Cellulomonas alba]MDM7853859.1 flavin reductase family protein [Cellulomonas alba]